MVETSLIEERAEAERHLAEAMRITNNSIRRVHKLGLTVDAPDHRDAHGRRPDAST
jgi:hypothetical protein